MRQSPHRSEGVPCGHVGMDGEDTAPAGKAISGRHVRGCAGIFDTDRTLLRQFDAKLQ